MAKNNKNNKNISDDSNVEKNQAIGVETAEVETKTFKLSDLNTSDNVDDNLDAAGQPIVFSAMSGEISMMSVHVVGVAESSISGDGAPTITPFNKDILITPLYDPSSLGNTSADTVSQIDFKWNKTSSADPAQFQETRTDEVRSTIYTYAQSAGSYDVPVLVLGANWYDGSTWHLTAPTNTYKTGNSGTSGVTGVAQIWIYPATGRIDADQFNAASAAGSGFNGLWIQQSGTQAASPQTDGFELYGLSASGTTSRLFRQQGFDTNIVSGMAASSTNFVVNQPGTLTLNGKTLTINTNNVTFAQPNAAQTITFNSNATLDFAGNKLTIATNNFTLTGGTGTFTVQSNSGTALSITVNTGNVTLTVPGAGATINVGGNFTTGGVTTFSGAFSTTLTVTAATSVTLPVAGTLLTTSPAGAQLISGAASTVALQIKAASTGSPNVTEWYASGGTVGTPTVGTACWIDSSAKFNGDGSLISNLNPTNLSGPVPLNKGGTNAANSASAGAVIYSTSTTFVPNTPAGSAGIPLVSGTSGTGAPTFSALNLAGGSTIVTGTLPIANGGTGGAVAPSAGQILVASSSTVYGPVTPTTGSSTQLSVTANGTTIQYSVNFNNTSTVPSTAILAAYDGSGYLYCNTPGGSGAATTAVANKGYVDSVAQGLDVKSPCIVSFLLNVGNTTTTGTFTQNSATQLTISWATLGACPFSAITAGSGAAGSVTYDSVAISGVADIANLGNRILIRQVNSAISTMGGIWVITSVTGTTSSGTAVLQRTYDANATTNLVDGAFTFVEEGTFAGDGYVFTTNPGYTLGSTTLTWSQFSGAGAYTAGQGITFSGIIVNANVNLNNNTSNQFQIQGGSGTNGSGTNNTTLQVNAPDNTNARTFALTLTGSAGTGTVSLATGTTLTQTSSITIAGAGNTLTLGGSLTTVGNFSTAGAVSFSGAFGTTITLTATTSVTLPTGGTLLTTAPTGQQLISGAASSAGIRIQANATGTPNIVEFYASGASIGTLNAGNGTTNAVWVDSNAVIHGDGSQIININAGNISTGTLSIARGGTGTGSAPTQWGVIYAASTTAYSSTAQGAANNVLIGNGAGAPTFTTISTLVSAGNTTITFAGTSTITAVVNQGYAFTWTAQHIHSFAPVTGVANDWVERWSTSPFAEATSALHQIGPGPWDGSTSGFFSGSASGTYSAINALSAFTGDLANWTLQNSSKFKVTYQGVVNVASTGAFQVNGNSVITSVIAGSTAYGALTVTGANGLSASVTGSTLTITASGGTVITGSGTQFNVAVFSATNALTSVGPGTANQVFVSGGASANPSYVNVSTIVGVGATLTTSGTTSITLGLNLTNANTWTALQTLNNGVTLGSASTLTLNNSGGANGPQVLFATGSAPTSLANGQLWYDGTNLYFRSASTNVNLLNTLTNGNTVGGGTNFAVLYLNGSSALVANDSNNFYFSGGSTGKFTIGNNGAPTQYERLEVMNGGIRFGSGPATSNGVGFPTTLTQVSGITSGTTGNVNVGASTNFPPFGTIVIDNEIMSYTAVVNGTTITIGARGLYGTTAAAHAQGASLSVISGLQTDGLGTAHTIFFSDGRIGIGSGYLNGQVSPESIVQLNIGAIGNTVSDGLRLVNETPATVGVTIQNAPTVGWGGTLWDTGAVASKYVRMRTYLTGASGNPVQPQLVFGYEISTSIVPSAATTAMTLTINGSGYPILNLANANGQYQINGNAITSSITATTTMYGAVTFVGGTNITVTNSGNTVTITGLTSTVTGTGTQYTLPMWGATSSALVNSNVSQNSAGTQITLGTTAAAVAIGSAGFTSNGILNIAVGSSTAATNGIYWGTDSYIFRPSSGALRTNAAVTIDSTLSVEGGTFVIGSTGTTTIKPGSDSVSLVLQPFSDTQTSKIFTVLNAAGSTTNAYMDRAGNFKAATKSFIIDHPTKLGMRLEHGSLEGPEHGAYCRGRVECQLINGQFRVELADYWRGLIGSDYTAHIDAIGDFDLYKSEQDESGFVVKIKSKWWNRWFNRNKKVIFEFIVIGARLNTPIVVEQEA